MSTIASGGELADRLGIEIVEASPERVVAVMPVVGNRQPHGIMHGGAFCVLGETLGSVAANLHAGSGAHAVGIDLNATHHRSARVGLVTATATALALGRSVCSHQVEIRDEEGALLSTVRITNLIRRDRARAQASAPPAFMEGLATSVDLLEADLRTGALTGDRALVRFDQMEVGVWEHLVGTSTDVEADEVAVVLSGRGTLTLGDGSKIELRPGVLFKLLEGEQTTWEISETIRKSYVARR